jgi:uncharacterized protein YcnI
MSTNRHLSLALRTAGVIVVAGTAALFGAGTASAHVTAKVIGETAAKGGYTVITFRVPNEDATAGTTKVEVKLPVEYPLTSVRTKPVAGWTAVIVKSKLDKPVESRGTTITEAVTSVTWTAAAGTRIGPGEYGEFPLSVGRLPENTDSLVIPAVQTYDNGKVVSWDAPPPAKGAEEPEHPAPVVALSAATGDAHGDKAAAGAAGAEDSHASSSDGTARWLGGAGLAVGALGLGVAAGATIRARRVTRGSGGDLS